MTKLMTKKEVEALRKQLREEYITDSINKSLKGINERIVEAVKKNHDRIVIELGQNDFPVYEAVLNAIKEAGYKTYPTHGTDSMVIEIK